MSGTSSSKFGRLRGMLGSSTGSADARSEAAMSAKELQQAVEFLNKRAIGAKAAAREATKLSMTPLAELAHVVLNSNEFVYIN